MAKLTEEEQRLLEELTAKKDAPDGPSGGGQELSIIVDLSDDNAVRRALSLGVLTRGDLAEFDESPPAGGESQGEGEGEGGEGKPAAKDKSPMRRLSIADRAMGAQNE